MTKAFLRWYVVEYEPEGWQNPISKVKSPKLKQEPLPPVNLADLSKMLPTCDKSFSGCRDRAMMLMLLDIELRANELLSLDLPAVHHDSTIAVQHGKGGKVRTAFIGSKTRRELQRYLRYHSGGDALWVTVSGERLQLSGLRQVLRRRATWAGVPTPAIHSFRRGFAVLSLKAGADLESLRKMLGHSDIGTTQHYLRLETDDLHRVHKKAGPVDRLL